MQTAVVVFLSTLAAFAVAIGLRECWRYMRPTKPNRRLSEGWQTQGAKSPRLPQADPD
jgi:hypothetical protein